MATYLLSVNFGASKSGQAANIRYSVRDSSPATRIAATNTGIAEKLDAAGTTGTGSYSSIVSIDDSEWTFPVEVLYSIVGQTGVGVVETIYYSPSAVPATVTDKTGFALAITPPTAVQIRQEMDNNSNDLNTIISNVAAVKTQTDKIPASPAAVGSAMTLDLTQALTLTSASTVGGALSGALNRFLKQVVVGVPGTAGSRLNIYKTDGTTLLASIDLSTANTAAPL